MFRCSIGWILALVMSVSLYGQVANHEHKTQLESAFTTQYAPYIQALNRYKLFPDSLSFLDSLTKAGLAQADFEVKYNKTKIGYVRKLSLSVPVSVPKDTVFTLHHTDSLTTAQLKTVRHNSTPETKGENPRFFATVLVPVAIISVSVAGILGLFYFRTQ